MTNMDNEDKNEEESRVIFSTSAQNISADSCNNCASSVTLATERSNAAMVCSSCQCPIYDKYYMWVDKRPWHENCVKCAACGRPLMTSCYMKNRKFYCQQDYKRLQKCRRCLHMISLNEYVLHVGGMPYHVKCFACDFCHRQLHSGDQYVINETANQIACTLCYARSDNYSVNSRYIHDENSVSDSERSDDDVFPHQSVPGIGHMTNYVQSGGLQGQHGLLRTKNGTKSTSSLALIGASGDGKRVKRPRTILTTAQRRKFKASFEVSQKPCRKVRETLAAETGLSPRVVQVWFQNQRAKMKKLARRQQGDGSGPGGSRAGSRSRRKKTTDSDSDNEVLSSPESYTPISTPIQNQLFSDAYRSPGSLQTSPTTSTSEVTPYFQQIPPSNHELPDMPDFSDFESNMFTSSDVYMTQSQNTVTSSENAASLSTEVRIHAGLHQPVDDFGNPRVSMVIDGEHVTATSPIDNFQTFNAAQPSMPPRFPNQGHEGTPMDRLMYMQNNYFRT